MSVTSKPVSVVKGLFKCHPLYASRSTSENHLRRHSRLVLDARTEPVQYRDTESEYIRHIGFPNFYCQEESLNPSSRNRSFDIALNLDARFSIVDAWILNLRLSQQKLFTQFTGYLLFNLNDLIQLPPTLRQPSA